MLEYKELITWYNQFPSVLQQFVQDYLGCFPCDTFSVSNISRSKPNIREAHISVWTISSWCRNFQLIKKIKYKQSTSYETN